MDNQTAIGLLTICAFVAVMILLGSFLLIRIMKSSIFGIANMVLRSVTDPVVEDKTSRVINNQSVHHATNRDLRAEARAVDFDAAVASRKGEAVPSIRTESTTPPPLNASAFSTTEPTSPASVRRQRRRLRQEQFDDEDDGELFEGLLGE